MTALHLRAENRELPQQVPTLKSTSAAKYAAITAVLGSHALLSKYPYPRCLSAHDFTGFFSRAFSAIASSNSPLSPPAPAPDFRGSVLSGGPLHCIPTPPTPMLSARELV